MSTVTYTLQEALNAVGHVGEIPEYITYDENLVSPELHPTGYWVRRGSRHDSTYLFTVQNIAKTIDAVWAAQTCHASQVEPLKALGRPAKKVHYTVGKLTIETEHGMQDLPAGTYPGVKETVSMPVICEVEL